MSPVSIQSLESHQRCLETILSPGSPYWIVEQTQLSDGNFFVLEGLVVLIFLRSRNLLRTPG